MSTPPLEQRRYLSTEHYYAAKTLCEEARKVEKDFEENPPRVFADNHRRRYRSFVIPAITSAAAFLDTAIAEFLSDVHDGHEDLPNENPALVAALARMVEWRIGRRLQLTPLEKYDFVLSHFQKEPFNKGAAPYQDAKLVVDLRNALVHYDPEWLMLREEPAPQAEQERLERALHGKFELSPFDPLDYPFFPERCISAACAEWAVESAYALRRAFRERMGQEPDHLPMSATRMAQEKDRS
jgi:hypothetical protein